ncbi:wax ester/triacylglycerol synthase family O-acyltransferase [Bradyrhizobium sp. AUGA SZCCT0182]|uniref:WS/DGAT/MGAT family O-acyltransferase n=1 Tax=Bradyrhizobium sp. AUGA SZCCT0182 TaxID=2807667 RepID=UPI001BA8C18F|nr:wax ester/triacylglycerol synthase family O-acyltransferase [Bradyrhizobium sp. AUGA SZCCT0182]MBR1232825.1 wax ester/triacylglycerol synthase family O-acyltransferase [Bradyrhizobium sp. AUGA SZCCT0182]
MDRLSALDASFLYGETPESPMHVAGLAIFGPAPADTDIFAMFRDHLKGRLHLVPFFERKLALAPIQLDHPVWVHDDNLDLDYHFRHTSLPKPGTQEQLETLVARLHMILLDRARPLWQYYVIEGLEAGGFAVYIKMHHAGIDGGAGMAALPIIFSPSPEPERAPLPSPPAKDSRAPEIFELISDSYAKFFNQQRAFYESWPDLAKAIAKVGQRATQDLANPPRMLPLAPKTLFNVSLSSQRSFGTCTLSLRDAKAVAKLTKSKINDVVMTISAGALRRYLELRKGLPDGPLIAAVPVSLRKAGNADMNNQVTAMLCNLATDIADPIRRLEAIVASSTDSKKRLEDIRDVIPADLTWLGAPIIITGMARLMGHAKLAEQLPAIVNVLISNVPGPKEPLYCAGARMLNYFPVSIPSNGSVLNITVQSYQDNLDFGLIACRAAVPDIEKLVEFLIDEFDRLRRAAGGPEQAKARKIEIREAKSA